MSSPNRATNAPRALKEGRLAEEIVPVPVPGRGGEVLVEEDEGIRPDTDLRSLGGYGRRSAAGGRSPPATRARSQTVRRR